MFKIKNIFPVILALLLLISTLTGCVDGNNSVDEINGANDDTVARGQAVSANQLASIIREGDFDEKDYIYDLPLHGVAQTQYLEWEINFDPADKGFDDLSQLLDVFEDSALTVSANPKMEYDTEKGMLIISPSRLPFWYNDYPIDEYSWGLSEQFFLVRYYSIDGEKLEKPVVTIFTIENGLEAPYVDWSVRDGFGFYSWKPVPGAVEYHLYIVDKKVNDDDSGYRYFSFPPKVIEETEFLYEFIDTLGGRIYLHNMHFRVEEGEEYFIALVAVGENSVSQFSNAIHSRDIAPFLPYSIAVSEDEDVQTFATDINNLGVYRWIEMCDGSLVKMPISYRIDEAEVYDLHLIAPSVFEPGEMQGMVIPYSVLNIGIEGLSVVRDFDYPEFEQDLQKLKDKEIDEHKTGMISPNIERATGDEEIPDEAVTLYIDEFKVFATTPLSEYLAIHMLNGAEHIDFRAFPEAFDSEYLIAAWQEAVCQNPLVLSVEGTSWTIFGDMFVEYGQTQEELKQKQSEIMNEVRSVVASIITDDMTDFEKQLAINNYLVETAEYDFAALENAEKNNFAFTDPSFNDSFTAYGVLINKVGVCASYAAAFKLLADEAGLTNIVITGNLYGSLPHAWNRVLIDGEWLTLDVTNNDDEYMLNIFFNLPDYVSKTILVEDNSYSMSDTKYTGNSFDWEYYRIEGLYYDIDEIAEALVAEMNENGYALLRTEYTITDEEFFEIVLAVIELGGFDINDLVGGMMLGAIYLSVS